MIPYIIMILSFLLDGILTNYLPYLVNDLSLFTPLLTLVSVIVILPFYRKKEKNYFITIFVLGILYDLFYTNLLFFNGVLFLIVGYFLWQVQKNIPINSINIVIEIVGAIILYESLTGIFLLIYNMVPVTLYKVFYKIIHSLLLNIIYGEVIYWILKIMPKKYKKISIN